MKNRWLLLSVMMLLVLGLMTACGGDDDDDDDGAPSDDDTSDDDDTGDDDTGDDDTGDDDTGDDDTGDDDTGDDDTSDTEYTAPDWFCELPDPESIGDGLAIGGGAVSDTITVYAFDDSDCSAVEGATVIHGGNTYTTDANGKATVTVAKANELVTVYKDGFWTWAYQADAAVMYFRLRPDSYGYSYTDSGSGDFTSGGTALGLENPDVSGLNLDPLLNAPIYLGIAIPGLARSTVLSADFDGLIAEDTFSLDYGYNVIGLGGETGTIDLPASIYFPELSVDINLIGLASATAGGANEQYKVPVMAGADNPIEGAVLSITAGEAISSSLIIQLITDLIGGNPIDPIELILDNIEAVLNNALTFEYAGAEPTWDGTGAPDITMSEITAKSAVNLSITGADPSYDYLGMLAAEVPNRALIPMGIKLATSNAASIPAGDVPDADYILLVAKTDALASGLESLNLGFALTFAEDLSDWSGGATVADSDFLPLFDSSTGYNTTTGEVSWALESKGTMDLVLVIFAPKVGPVVLAVINGEEDSFQPPVSELGITPSADDVVVIAGIDLPDGVDPNEFNPTQLLAYDSTAINIWTNYDIAGLIPVF
ncbi:MAG TPA: hypothetical protein PKW95_05200 [bacterium]|nr:hypothetical protein [bacterium]